MTKKAFREKMFKVKMIVFYKPSACCYPLYQFFGTRYLIFDRLYRDIDDELNVYYFGEHYTQENQLMRIDALSLFEEYCITEGIYKEF